MRGYFDKKAFAELLNIALGGRSINQYERDSGVSAAHISRLMRQLVDAPPSPQTIEKLAAKAYNGVSYEDFMKAAGHLAPHTQKGEIPDFRVMESRNAVGIKEIPIFTLRPSNRDDIFSPGNVIGWEPVSADTMANIAIKIDDDSMSGSRIYKGDRVIIQEQKTFEDGQIVLVQLPDRSLVIRKATHTNEGIILSPDNPNYQPQFFNLKHIRIIGIVIRVIFDI